LSVRQQVLSGALLYVLTFDFHTQLIFTPCDVSIMYLPHFACTLSITSSLDTYNLLRLSLLFHLVLFCITHALCLAIHMLAGRRDQLSLFFSSSSTDSLTFIFFVKWLRANRHTPFLCAPSSHPSCWRLEPPPLHMQTEEGEKGPPSYAPIHV
jgi:hypothetical protein